MNDLAPQTLKIFQHDFLSAINNDLPSSAFTASIKTIGALSPKEILALYRDDYRFRLAHALGETYETCWCLLGDEDFFELAFKYIWQHPSSFYNLSNYGKGFPHFLQNESQINNDLILEMANFELQFWNLFHAQVTQKKELGHLLNKFPTLESSLQQPWHFHSELYFFNSSWRLWDLFGLRKNGLGDQSFEDFQIPQSGILYRQDAIVKAAILPQEQWNLLQKMRNGMTPLDAMTSSPTAHPDMIQELFTFLTKHPLVAAV